MLPVDILQRVLCGLVSGPLRLPHPALRGWAARAVRKGPLEAFRYRGEAGIHQSAVTSALMASCSGAGR